jgi:hypothetical protein
MRSHGVPNFPDPTATGGIPPISASSGINTDSPAFEAAQSACRQLGPDGNPPSGEAQATSEARWLKIAECMRRHGVPNFPDPTHSMPSNQDAYSFISDQNGVVVALRATIDPNSPAFTGAAASCKWQLPKFP